MPFTYDPTTDRGRVRLMATDIDSTNAIFQDAEIDTFLALEGDSVKLAAAQALETIASNEALVQKKTRMLDIATDGPAVAKELRERAAALRTQVAIDAELSDDELAGSIDWAEMVTGPFSAAERIEAEALREGA